MANSEKQLYLNSSVIIKKRMRGKAHKNLVWENAENYPLYIISCG